MEWLLFVYTLPSQPSRKRAYVWRELKKLGALYLRDGVAVLPALPAVAEHLGDMTARVLEYEGTADLLPTSGFTSLREQELVNQFRQERESEYREIYRGGVRFLRDVLDEVSADDFGFPDVGNLESELHRLHRWFEQVRERDYFQAPGHEHVAEVLAKCDRAFDHFTSTASTRGEGEREDIFERLSGPSEPMPPDYPL